jgi:hypothetical protein
MPMLDPLRRSNSWWCPRCECKVPLMHLHPANEPEIEPPKPEPGESTVARWW